MNKNNKSGYTLVELLIGIVFVAAGIVSIGFIIGLVLIAVHFLAKVW